MEKKSKRGNKSVILNKRLEEINSRADELILENNKLFNYDVARVRLRRVVHEISSIKDKIEYSPLAISEEDIANLEMLKLEREELEKDEKLKREKMKEIEKELGDLGNEKRKLLVDEDTLKEIGEKQSNEKITGNNKNSVSKINIIQPSKSKSKKIKIYEFIDKLIDLKEINFNEHYNETSYYVNIIWQNYMDKKPSKESLRHYNY